jgi:tetratricopeptide (TPR) repeat protein
MESDSSLRHLPFFEELGKMEESESSWRSVSAGLVVLRLLDAWVEDRSVTVDGAWGIGAVADAIEQIDQWSPTRRILSGIVDAMRSTEEIDMHVITPRLMAYAQDLEYDARWALAADVYRTIVSHGHPTDDGDLVIPATIQLGHCLKNLGDLHGAAQAYAHASQVANANGDLIGVLRARIGEAKIATMRGNMPVAEAMLDSTIAQASEHGLDDVQSRALHDRAGVAGMRGQYDRVVQFGYKALDLSTSQRERDRILADIATGFLDLGLVEVARDAYLVLTATAQDQYVRWTAGLNLIDVASQQGMEPMFDRYRRDFENVELPPFLEVQYCINVGNGYRGFGRATAAIPYLERAVRVAGQFGLNQLLFMAEESLAGAKSSAARPAPAAYVDPSPEVLQVADKIRTLRRERVPAGV